MKGRNPKHSSKLIQHIQDKLELTWSPEQIVGRDYQGIGVYFADAYSAWQRGTNENSNGLLREYFPKKTDLSKVTPRELYEVLWLKNNRPMKCLDFHTPFEVFMHELSLI